MVYPGRPSTGCHLCRARKIKCDEKRPGCDRCARYGEPCPGYREESEQRNRRNMSKRRVAPNSSERRDEKPEWSSISPERQDPEVSMMLVRSSGSPSDGTNPTLMPLSNGNSLETFLDYYASSTLRPPPSQWEQQAINHFFNNWVVPSRPNMPGWFDFVPEYYSNSPEETVLHSVVRAVAYAHLSIRTNIGWMQMQANRNYGKALRLTHEAIGDPAKAISDDTLTAVMLLTAYDTITGDIATNTSGAFRHEEGLKQLLRLRGPGQRDTARGIRLWRAAHGHLQLWALRDGREPNVISTQALSTANLESPSARAATAFYRATRLVSSLKRLQPFINADSTARDELINVMAHASEVDLGLETWAVDAPDVWRPKAVDLEMPDYQIYGQPIPRVDVFGSLWLGCLHNFARVARLRLNRDVLSCAQALNIDNWNNYGQTESIEPMDPETTDEERTIQRIQKVVDDICASIPFMLGDVDSKGNLTLDTMPAALGGYYMLWPLTAIKQCVTASPERHALAAHSLQRIGLNMGIRQAFRL